MTVEMDVTYEGKLRCRALHGPSGDEVLTDAPTDNHGRGEAFSPTDLVVASLGACMLTIMGIVAEREQIDMAGMKVRVIKEMVEKPKRRIGKITLRFTLPEGKRLEEKQYTKLQRAAQHCPVHGSLHPEVKLDIQFE